jgi:hypothetical protein
MNRVYRNTVYIRRIDNMWKKRTDWKTVCMSSHGRITFVSGKIHFCNIITFYSTEVTLWFFLFIENLCILCKQNIYLYIYKHTYKCTNMYVSMYYVYTCVCMYVCMYVRMYVCVSVSYVSGNKERIFEFLNDV